MPMLKNKHDGAAVCVRMQVANRLSLTYQWKSLRFMAESTLSEGTSQDMLIYKHEFFANVV